MTEFCEYRNSDAVEAHGSKRGSVACDCDAIALTVFEGRDGGARLLFHVNSGIFLDFLSRERIEGLGAKVAFASPAFTTAG